MNKKNSKLTWNSRKNAASFLFMFLVISCFAQENSNNTDNKFDYLNTLLIPLIIAVIGYILKILYEALVERSKRRRALLEEKLKNFYWPILTRIEENNAIWRLMISKRDKLIDLDKKIGLYVEENIVLKNHREIMSILINYRYCAKFDEEFSSELNKYFMHVATYEGIIQSKAATFPGLIGAPYPTRFDDIIKERTEALQKQLDRKMIW